MALAALGIAAAGLAAYANSFGGQFLFDDRAAIVENPCICRLWPVWEAMSAPKQTPMSGRPIVNLSFALNYAAGGLDPWGYHAVNLSIHVLAGLALFGIVRRTLLADRLRKRFAAAATPLALATALIWTVHPLQTESVTYVVQRAEAMVGLFYLLTLYCAIRAWSSPRRLWWGAAAVGACALGMATKEVMVTAPMLVLIYDRVFVHRSWRRAFRRSWPLHGCLAATWGILGAITAYGPRGTVAGFGMRGLTPLEYAGSQFGVILHYLRLAFWPDPLILDYSWPVARSVADVVLPAVPILMLLAGSLWALHRRPALGFVGLAFFLILAPTSSIVPIRDLAFEHRMYLPLAAVAVLAVVAAHRLLGKLAGRFASLSAARSWIAAGAVAAVVFGLGAQTVRRNRDYRSEVDMWQDVVAKCPDNARGHNNLGHALQEAGRAEEALRSYRTAAAVDPNFVQAHYNLGSLLAKTGRFDQAIRSYERAIALDGDHVSAQFNLANALVQMGRSDEAVAHYERAARIRPDFAEARFNLANTLVRLRRFAEAMHQFEAAERSAPRKRLPKIRSGLASALAEQGRYRQAATWYARALEADPDYMPALNNLAWLLGTCPAEAVRDGPEAVRLAERAAALAGESAGNLDTLAAACAGAGDFARAAATQRRAIDLASAAATSDPAYVDELRARLALYVAGRPWRDRAARQPAGDGTNEGDEPGKEGKQTRPR